MKGVAIETVEGPLALRVAADAAAWYGLDAIPQLQQAWRIDNPYSTVWCLRYGCTAWSGRFFVKQAKHMGVNRAALRTQLQVEYDVLSRLQTAPALPSLAAAPVQPLAFYADMPALATLAAEGPTLRRVYARDARRWSAREAAPALLQRAALAGRWLADFQDRTLAGSGPFDIDGLQSYLQVRLQRLRKAQPEPFGEAWLAALLESVSDKASALSRNVALCGRHNDFASHNLIAGPRGTLRILDFQAFDQGASAYDACNFWLELELLKLDPSYSAELLAKMQRAFLEGYGRIEPGQPEFELARLRYTLNRLLNELDNPQRLRALSLRWQRTVAGTTGWLQRFAATAMDRAPGART